MDLSIFLNEKGNFKHHVFGIESYCFDFNYFLKQITRNKYFDYCYHKEIDFLNIDEVRNINRLQNEHGKEKKLFIISFQQTNQESQNAFLKTLEEPSGKSYFIIIFPQKKALLDTLLSRIYCIDWNEKIQNNYKISIQNYLSKTLEEKFLFNKKILKDENIIKKDILIFVNHLEIYFAKEKRNNNFLQNIFIIKKFLGKPQLSLKLILDNIAIQLEK